MRIDKKTYKISDSNYYKNKSPKSQIVIANSLRKKNYHITHLQHKDLGLSKKWSNYTINREGKIYEHFDVRCHSDFLGVKDGDRKSISIVLENMGCLFKTSDDNYVNWLNEYCDANNVVEKKWMGYNYWEKYSNQQLISLIELLKKLCDDYSIPPIFVEFQHYHNDISKYRGIVFKTNYIDDGTNVSPLLDPQKLNEMLNNKFI